MRRNSIVVLLISAILGSGLGLALAQSEDPSLDPAREIIVMFQPGIVEPPSGRTSGRVDEFQIASDTLKFVLQNVNVEAISRLMSDFRPEDRFTVSRTGEAIELTDWTNVYVVRLPVALARQTILDTLQTLPEVVYAEINGRSEPGLVPNDQFFNQQWALKNDGTQAQGYGTPGADIDATEAWDITVGSSSVKIGIVDNGMETNHPDFTGRVTGDAGDDTDHGTVVTGIAAAQGNNSNGIAGVAWNTGIINEDYGNGSDANVAAAVRSASDRGAQVINNSYFQTPVGRFSLTIRLAFSDVFKENRAAIAIMGNEGEQGDDIVSYPAAFGQGILSVGATTNTDVKANYSNTGSWIDVSAPGGGGLSANQTEDYIYSTVPGSGYGYFNAGNPNEGTSFAAPHVSGIAALLLSYNSSLYNDDIEQIIRLGVDDKGPTGFDNEYGTGRINAKKALDYLRDPYSLSHATATNGTVYSTSGTFLMTFYSTPGLADGVYSVKRYVIRKTVNFPLVYSSVPNVWGRGVASNGYNYSNPNYAMGWCTPVSGTVSTTGATLETVVYEVWTIGGQYKGFIPTTTSNAVFAYTALGVPNPPSVYITGPTSLGYREYGTWTANPSGGNGSYTYEWRYRYWGTGPWSGVVGTNQTYGRTMKTKDFELQVKVTSQGLDAYDTHYVTYEDELLKRTAESTVQIPEQFALSQNYPNPFNPTTEIKYELPEASHVTLSIFNVVGQKIRTLVDEQKEPGYHSVQWDSKDGFGNEVASGIYVYRIYVRPDNAGSKPFESLKKLTLLR